MQILQPFNYANRTFIKGEEAQLCSVTPQTRLNEFYNLGYITGDFVSTMPTPPASASVSDLMAKVNDLEAYKSDDIQQTAARTQYFEDQKNQVIQNVERIVSTPVPVGLFSGNYVASPDDQRLIFSSETDGSLTLPTAKNLYKRRSVIRNSMRGGKLTVVGKFVAANGVNSIIENPVLDAGEGLETIGFFDTSATPDDTAPDDFRMNGQLTPNALGKYRIFAVIYDKKNYSKEQLDAKFTNSETLISTSAANTLSTIRANVPAAGDNLNKLYNLILALNAIVGSSAPDADSFVNAVSELLQVFSTYPEGVDLAVALNGKVSTSAIINSLVETSASKALDARQGKVLKDLIDALATSLANHTHANATTSAAGFMSKEDKAKSDAQPPHKFKLAVSTGSILGLNLISGLLGAGNFKDVPIVWDSPLAAAPRRVDVTLKHATGASGTWSILGEPTATGCTVRVVNLESTAKTFTLDLSIFI